MSTQATAGPHSKRFRVALSFAGEKRTYVEEVAKLLADRFGEGAVLYDKFHEAEFARHDLGMYLPKLYSEQSDLIVPILCPKYDVKRWTGWEWLHIYGLLTKEDGRLVMPSRFEYAEADGLSPVCGFIELDQKTPTQFVTRILERLALNEGRSKDYYTKSAEPGAGIIRTSIPHNLPTLQPFFGREDELQKIAEALDPVSRTWGALIDGPGGMGKTSLAVRAAYAVSPDAFERIVFVTLKSREQDDDGVRDLSGFLISGLNELFGELARVLKHPDIVRSSEDQRPRLLLDALHGTKTLLILDNLESLTKPERDTVFTFVKRLPPSCKAILTSRMRVGSAAEELILEKLSEEAALATLAELATHNPALARTSEAERLVLYRETGGKPLLLRWTAGQIGRGSCITFTDAIAYLRSCPKGNDPLEFIFGDLVDGFSEAETRALCALTYFTLPATVAHLATVAEREEAEILAALKSLANRSLVVPSDEYRTFTLIPLVADFLRVKKPELIRETGDRLEKHVYALVVENGYKEHDRFPLLDAAWPTIAAALPRMLAGDNGRLQTVCDALLDFLHFTWRRDECLALSRDAEARAMAAGDFSSAGWRAYLAGQVYYLRCQSSEVFACADRAEAHWREAKDGSREHIIATSLRGFGYRLTNNYLAAITAFREAVEFYRSLPREDADTATALNDLASIEHLSGDYDSAERNFREALRIFHVVGNEEGVAIQTGNLAALSLSRGDWIKAETLARAALALSEKIGRLELVAVDNLRLAIALVRQGKKAEAFPYARRAVELYQEPGDPAFADARETLRECEAG